MSSILKSKLSYASLGKPRKPKEHEKILKERENDCIYDTILSGMNETEKDYITDLIRARRNKEDKSLFYKKLAPADTEAPDRHHVEAYRYNSPQLSPKLKHVQSLEEVAFMDHKTRSHLASLRGSTVLQSNPVTGREESENFIGCLDGYITKLEGTDVSKTKGSQQADFQRKYKHLSEIYMEHINTSKQKEQKLLQYIKRLKKRVTQLEGKVAHSEQQNKEFAVLWKCREDQLNILLGVEKQMGDYVYNSEMRIEKDTGCSSLDLESEEESQGKPWPLRPKCSPSEQIKRKSRHTINYY